jgi:Gpi18-like mannosyltransferase
MAQRQRKNRDRHARPGWFVPVGILLLALALRMIWVRDPGCPYDIPFFVRWMRLAAQHGVAQAFTVARSSYPPLSVYLLQMLGLFSSTGTIDAAPTPVELLALRVAIIFFDLVAVAVLYRLGQRAAGRTTATWAALLYALCPGGIYLSVWWAQIDAWFVLPMLLGVWWLSQRRIALAWAALGLAVGLKLQTSILLPVFVVGTWRWCGLRRLVIGGVVLLLAVGTIVAPLFLNGGGSVLLSKTTYPMRSLQWITLTSHNLWYALTPHARAVGHAANRDQNVFVAGVSFHDAGLALLALSYGLILGRLFIRSGPRAAFAACAVTWLAFFTLATRTHVRYIFPALALMLCAGFYQRRWWTLYGVAATTLLVNLVSKSLGVSPLSRALTATPDQAVATAWVNVTVLGLASAFYVIPLLKSAYHQASLEGTLRKVEHGWEVALFGVAGVALLATTGAVFWRGRTVGAQIAQLQAPLRASLDASLDGADEPERAVVVNWPGAILAGRSAFLLGIIPVTPPALFLTTPDIVERGTIWVQYPPWQQDAGLEIEYYGTHVTQAELATLVQQAERVVVFSPQIGKMVVLAQDQPTVTPSACLVSFDGQACLTVAQAAWREPLLQIELTWQVTGTLPADETVFVHVIDEHGNLTAQADGDPAGSLVPLASLDTPARALYETRLIFVPPGNYRVRVGVYNRASGERLRTRCGPSSVCVDNAVEIGPLSSGS